MTTELCKRPDETTCGQERCKRQKAAECSQGRELCDGKAYIRDHWPWCAKCDAKWPVRDVPLGQVQPEFIHHADDGSLCLGPECKAHPSTGGQITEQREPTEPCPGCRRVLSQPFESGRWRSRIRNYPGLSHYGEPGRRAADPEATYQHEHQDQWADCPGKPTKPGIVERMHSLCTCILSGSLRGKKCSACEAAAHIEGLEADLANYRAHPAPWEKYGVVDLQERRRKGHEIRTMLERERDMWKQNYTDLAEKGAHEAVAQAAENQRLRAALEEIIQREDKAWKPMRVFRSEQEADEDVIRHETWTQAADIAREALKETP